MNELIVQAISANRLLRRTWFAILVGICLYSGPSWLGLAFVVAIFALFEGMDYLQRRQQASYELHAMRTANWHRSPFVL